MLQNLKKVIKIKKTLDNWRLFCTC